MKPTILSEQNKKEERCAGASCLTCRDCKFINVEERRPELKNHFPQLYGREAEHYFFYYAVNAKSA
jgi:hypothetical protein